jgi:hypothetical protein
MPEPGARVGVSPDLRALENELIKVQREARTAMDALRVQLAAAGLRREILLWTQVRDVMAKEPVDMDRLVDLLLQAHTLEQAKKKGFYL